VRSGSEIVTYKRFALVEHVIDFKKVFLSRALEELMAKPNVIRPLTRHSDKPKGICSKCSVPATVEALFEETDVTILRRYCDRCLAEAVR
jgi:hypothetical protein